MAFNFFPAYRRTGARIGFLSDDWREIHIRLGLSWKTKNYVGTVFGGSIYGALDPIYMVQLINILGNTYVVWDKSATVKFLKPISKTVYARFLITDELLNEIVSSVASNKKHAIDLPARFEDERGVVYAEVTKTLFIADKKYYESLKSRRSV
jgi:acyl-coenzyme A thioesterase PaaI-like protein